jgi:hypothetical protein
MGQLFRNLDFSQVHFLVVEGENTWLAMEGLDQLLEYCDCILTTRNLISGLMKKQHNRKDILKKLLEHSKARVIASGVQAVARLFDLGMFSAMLDRYGHYIHITERTMGAATRV